MCLGVGTLTHLEVFNLEGPLINMFAKKILKLERHIHIWQSKQKHFRLIPYRLLRAVCTQQLTTGNTIIHPNCWKPFLGTWNFLLDAFLPLREMAAEELGHCSELSVQVSDC